MAFHEDKRRSYFRCESCALIFADPASHLSPALEKARYERHQNSAEDDGYRRFLGRLADPLVARLGPGSWVGLDYGCGPVPVLAAMLAERGHRMATYDPFFAEAPEVLSRQYDFVTCTEVVEHFRNPGQEWGRLHDLVKPGGWLGIMTQLADAFTDNTGEFEHWHYKRDLTHVSFFSRKTFNYLAQRDGLDAEFVGGDIILLQRGY